MLLIRGEHRMAIALKATKEYLAKLDELSRRDGFDYTIYFLPAVNDTLRGTQGETLAALNAVSPKPVISTVEASLMPREILLRLMGISIPREAGGLCNSS